jgi:hypothetical protein
MLVSCAWADYATVHYVMGYATVHYVMGSSYLRPSPFQRTLVIIRLKYTLFRITLWAHDFPSCVALSHNDTDLPMGWSCSALPLVGEIHCFTSESERIRMIAEELSKEISSCNLTVFHTAFPALLTKQINHVSYGLCGYYVLSYIQVS